MIQLIAASVFFPNRSASDMLDHTVDGPVLGDRPSKTDVKHIPVRIRPAEVKGFIGHGRWIIGGEPVSGLVGGEPVSGLEL